MKLALFGFLLVAAIQLDGRTNVGLSVTDKFVDIGAFKWGRHIYVCGGMFDKLKPREFNVDLCNRGNTNICLRAGVDDTVGDGKSRISEEFTTFGRRNETTVAANMKNSFCVDIKSTQYYIEVGVWDYMQFYDVITISTSGINLQELRLIRVTGNFRISEIYHYN